jgi:hypothetical protein
MSGSKEDSSSGSNSNGGRKSSITLDQAWLERFEHDQEIQNKEIGELTKNVSALTSTVQAMLDAQKAIFGRQNRPLPWGAVIGGITLLGICTGLIIAPIKENIEDQRHFDLRLMEITLQDARSMGKLEERTHWIEKLEERSNERIHQVFRKD